VIGTLKSWEILSRLGSIEEPVLLTSGRHDEATPAQMAAIAARLPQAEWVLFEESGHLAHAEEPERYMAAVGDFLARAEAGRVRRRPDVAPRSESFLAAVTVDPASLARSAGAGRLTGREGIA